MSASAKTAVLVVGFGGPASPEEVRPFLDSVTGGARIPEKRIQEVIGHYEALGGVSPYNAEAARLVAVLETWLRENGTPLPVGLAFRHSKPSLNDAFARFREEKVDRVVVVVLSPLRSRASFDRYRERVEEAAREESPSIEVAYIEPFHADPLLAEALADRIGAVLAEFSAEEPAYFLFSAHSIPAPMDAESGYAAQFEELCRLAAEKAGLKSWGIAYQSRSGNPRDAWLEPDVRKALKKIPRTFSNLVVVPAGFLCENVEILYDLDTELKQAAESAGFGYYRVSPVLDHPKFVGLLGRLVREKTGAE
ncbi:MAG TPA: ferrochelatase [Candidatus Eisenbacteria bacterium]|nr:ferrochelatase [Candidatus Eisenbacteria bacterium]